MLFTIGSGNPIQEPIVITTTAIGYAFGLSYPPILENIIPPINTPATGPVIAAIAK